MNDKPCSSCTSRFTYYWAGRLLICMAATLILFQQETVGQQVVVPKSKLSGTAGEALLRNFPSPGGYVNDFGHLLSPEAVARVDGICSQIDHSRINAQIVVVTINTLDGADIAEFAKSLANKWGIGHKGSNRGVLILLAVKDHKWRITVGYGLESIITDTKAAEIGHEAARLLHANNYEGGVTQFVTQVARVIDENTKAKLNDAPGAATKSP